MMFDSFVSASSQSLGWTRGEIEKRREDQEGITARANALLERERGIPRYLDMVENMMPADHTALTLGFARQIATVSLEQVAVELLAEWMAPAFPVRAEIMEFPKDSWAANSYKKSLVTLPLIRGVRGSTLDVHGVKVVPKKERSILSTMPLLASIPVRVPAGVWGEPFEGYLPAFHHELRRRAALRGGTHYDFSPLFEWCVRHSSRPPSFVFVQERKSAVRSPSWSASDPRYMRPPASWYYLPYLCMFLTGSRALIATTIEEDDEGIRQLFLESIAMIREAVGWEPLILWVPHLSRHLFTAEGKPLDFTEMPTWLFQHDWRAMLSSPSPALTVYGAAEQFLHSLVVAPPRA